MNTNQILAESDNISLNATSAENQSKLCDTWPLVKQGLTLLSEVIKNPIIRVLISSIIAAGDAITSKICR
jgi:hypothetical protein